MALQRGSDGEDDGAAEFVPEPESESSDDEKCSDEAENQMFGDQKGKKIKSKKHA